MLYGLGFPFGKKESLDLAVIPSQRSSVRTQSEGKRQKGGLHLILLVSTWSFEAVVELGVVGGDLPHDSSKVNISSTSMHILISSILI